MATNADKRQFERFPVDFKIEVTAHGRDGGEHSEKTILEEISCEGARFLTGNSKRYFIGQSLEVSIWLPGSDEVKASMKGSARVVWIRPCSDAGSMGEAQRVCVAVKFDAPLYFERYSAP